MRMMVRSLLRSSVATGALAAVALSSGIGAVAQAAGSPTVSVSPGLAWPGLSATVHGSGFRAGQQVAVSLDGVILSRVRAGKAGGFSTSVRVPTATTAGTHQLIASAGSGSGAESASTSLRARLQWSQLGLYAGHRSANWTETALNARTVKNTTPLWTSPAGGPGRDGMVLAQGALIWGTGNGATAISATTGKPLWTFDLPEVQLVGTAYDPVHGLVYLLDPGDSTLFALDPQTGDEVWYHAFYAGAGPQGLTVVNGVIYLIAGRVTTPRAQTLTAFDPATQTVLWQTPVEDSQVTTPVLYNGKFYVAGTQLAAYDATSGKALWSVPVGNKLNVESLNVSPDGIVATASDDLIHMYDLNTGAPMWASKPPGEAVNLNAYSVLEADGKVFADYGNDTTAFDAVTGTTVWSEEGHTEGSLSYANGLLYGGADKGASQYSQDLTAVLASNGQVVGSWLGSSFSEANTIIADGTIYIPGNRIIADQLPQQ